MTTVAETGKDDKEFQLPRLNGIRILSVLDIY